ncbi:MAG TPA: hypothetical protein VGH28_24335 [Polyangiaceae bacterium]|jgi:hypothetical protein
MKLTLASGVAVALALVACQPNYAYLPVTNATIIRGNVAAEYPIPADIPHGDVRVASYGIVDVGPRHPKNPADRLRALHLRFTVENSGDRDWTFDTSQQRITLAGYGTNTPGWASASAGGAPPLVHIPAMQKRTVDLFFPLPAALQRAKELPAFDVVWHLQAYDKLVSHRTPFERVVIQPPSDYYGPYDYGNDYWWGPPYWSNPAYGGEAFVGGVTVPRRFYGAPVQIHREPDGGRFMERGNAAPAQPH